MTLTLAILGCFSFFELLIWAGPLWRYRKILARIYMAALAAITLALLAMNLRLWTVLLAIFSIYRCINLARVAVDRIQPEHLLHASRAAELRLIGLQAVVIIAVFISSYYEVSPHGWWDVLAAVQLACAAVLLSSTLRHLHTSQPPKLRNDVKDSALPTLTVAIPARNETTDLEECLQTVVASTYPKLEVLVLDDCSQNQRTPGIIREFAQAGVRFIAGQEPPASWLAKNYAYEQLVSEANSELILFCGVDTRFKPESFTVMVKTLLEKQKTMISLLPKNEPSGTVSLQSLFIQPGRYAWELALPRRLLERPPVLSTCWLITREALEAAGGFKAVRRKGVPESYFAKQTAMNNDGYSFLYADETIGLTSRKDLAGQKATAIRTRYLQLHRRIELVALVSLLELALLVLPPFMFVIGLLSGEWLIAFMSGISYMMIAIMYARIINLAYRRFLTAGTFIVPLAALYDIGLLNYSMWQYEFREVLWKGRNVCLPIMRVIPELPKLPKT